MAKARILIVEDERIVAEDIKRSLQNFGYAVTGAVVSGEEALQKAGELQPDLVLMDIVLPGKTNGIEATDQIHSRFNIPVVYLTAYADEEMLARAKVTEPYGYLLKPFVERELYTTIEMALYKRDMERKLKDSEERYRTIFETTGTATLIIEEDTTISVANAEFEKLCGYSREEIEGKKSWTEFVVKDDLERMKEHHRLQRIDEEAAPGNYEFRFIDRYGKVKDVFLTVAVIPGAKKSVASLLDITERKKAVEELRSSEERFKALTENAPIGIYYSDFNGTFLYGNKKAEEITGYKREEFIGKSFLKLALFTPRGIVRATKLLAINKLGKSTGPDEFILNGKNGTKRLVEINTNVITIAEKKVVLGMVQDITERKRAEERLGHFFVNLAETVSRAAGSRDPYTAGHQRRVAELARLVGEKMGLDKNRVQGLYIGGLLHDIGKLSTPEVILSKPGALTEEEWNLIHAHAKQGYKILNDTDLPWPIADMALHHHERLDGSGYPHGISGDKLSLENRILGVCDVVEAMSAHRPYRPARSKEEVLEEIKGGRGTKYDPAVVDIMLHIIESGELDLLPQAY